MSPISCVHVFSSIGLHRQKANQNKTKQNKKVLIRSRFSHKDSEIPLFGADQRTKVKRELEFSI